MIDESFGLEKNVRVSLLIVYGDVCKTCRKAHTYKMNFVSKSRMSLTIV